MLRFSADFEVKRVVVVIYFGIARFLLSSTSRPRLRAS